MSTWTSGLAADACVFLLTYWVHSTLLITAVWGLLKLSSLRPVGVGRRPRLLDNSELRVLFWKIALSLPLVTSCGVTLGLLPHVGIQLAIHSFPENVSELGNTASLSSSPAQLAGVQYMPSQDPEELHFFSGEATYDAPPTMDAKAGLGWNRQVAWHWVCAAWLAMALWGMLRLVAQLRGVGQLRRMAQPFRDPHLRASLTRILQQLRVQQPVALLRSAEDVGPLTAGVLRPFILLPGASADQREPSELSAEPHDLRSETLSAEQWDALLAHEVAHIAHRDAAWNLWAQVVSRLFCLQPLNRFASRQLRREMDFVADLRVVQLLGRRTALAQCLIRQSERRVSAQNQRGVLLTCGMATFRSALGQRIEILLDDQRAIPSVGVTGRRTLLAVTLSAGLATAAILPRAVAEFPPEQTPTMTRNDTMKNPLFSLAVLTGLAMPAAADEGAKKREKPAAVVQVAELKQTPDELPDGVANFNGMLVGRLAAKDVEKGTFVVVVDAVPRVWENSKAENPKGLVGKAVQVEGVFGKFLDVLVVMKPGETIEFEAQYSGGNAFRFPGELLRKVAPFDPSDYPELPEEFRGFEGAVAAEVLKKDPETFELIVKVQRVLDTWKNSDAKKPESVVGKSVMLAGFWNRKDAYHDLKVGDRIEVGVRHIGRRSEHLNVAEFVRAVSSADQPKMEREASVVEEGSAAIRGFRGMLVGRLVSKDVERGTFTITVDAVPRIWNNNQSSKPKSLIGKQVEAGGVTGRMLDALVVAKVGDTLEIGALHDGGDRVRVGEVLRKVAPVEPGSYPELPDAFRGFKGMLTAKVVRKDEHLLDLIVEVQSVDKAFAGSTAENAESIVGKRATLAGFWNRKEVFHELRTGDVIEVGVEHPQRLSDHLSVSEGIEKK